MAMNAHELSLYYDRLAAHDWYYVMSDDHAVFERGLAEDRALATIADSDEHASAMYAEFVAYHSTGPMFGCERAPMPERPTGQLSIV